MYRPERLQSTLARLAAEFIAEHWTGEARITVMRVEVRQGLKEAVIYVKIDPETKEKAAFGELARMRPKLYNDIAGKLKTKFSPRLEFRIDKGEKNRARIEELLKKT